MLFDQIISGEKNSVHAAVAAYKFSICWAIFRCVKTIKTKNSVV
jgi:hypothetical protein